MSRCAGAGLFSLVIWLALVPSTAAQPPHGPPTGRTGSVDARPVVRVARGELQAEEVPPPHAELLDRIEAPCLVLEVLIADVVERHPSVAAAAAAWRAAAERYPQAVSLDDPMLDLMVAPASLGSNDVDFAYVVQGRQKLPWHGKRPLRGQVATHQAQAAAFEVADARLALVEVTSLAYFDYYLARRRLSLNAQNQKTVADLRSTALSRYENQLVSQQDVLLADVDAAELAQRQVDLEQSQRVAMARINTLLLRLPLAPLPDPPSVLPRIAAIAPVEVLAERAFSQRPDLAAAWKRLRADQAGVALAWREYKPDLELVGRYDTFWQAPEQQLQGQVGLTLNVPLARDRRRAAVREAGALVGQRRAEIDRLVAQISLEIQSAFERAEAARKSLDILRQRILPAAESSFATANSSYVSGTIDFLRVVEAQRQLLMFRDRFVEAEVALHIRVAELERVLAGPILWLENPVVPQR